MKKIILEIGSNDGREIEKLLNQCESCVYYGFEPTIELYTILLQKYKNKNNVNFFPIAISNYNGFSQFNVAGQSDWGCSSLFEFQDDIHQIWPGRPDFKTTHTYKVPVMKMSTFLNSYIDDDYCIEYAWIDAQGSDIDVLFSFEDKITKIKKGRIEVSQNTELYKKTKNTISNAIEFLEKNNFRYNIFDDPHGGREADIEFFI